MNADLLFRWRGAVVSENGPARPVTRFVLLVLSLHMDAAGGSCFPSVRRLADETGLSRRVVMLHLKTASEAGWLQKSVFGLSGKGWRRQCYTASIPSNVVTLGDHVTSKGGDGEAPRFQEGGHFDDTNVVTQSNPSSSVNSSNISSLPEIEKLKSRYSSRHLIDSAFRAIASTRKSGKVADTIILAQLKKWERYPTDHVIAGIQTYLDKDCAGDGKAENYLLGIIRGTAKRSSAKSPAPKTLTPNPMGVDFESIYAN